MLQTALRNDSIYLLSDFHVVYEPMSAYKTSHANWKVHVTRRDRKRGIGIPSLW